VDKAPSTSYLLVGFADILLFEALYLLGRGMKLRLLVTEPGLPELPGP
jgi:hypothetical protein